jgi:CHAD domain-containing protein
MDRLLSAKARTRLADRVRLIAKLCRHMAKCGRSSRTCVHELRRACRAAEAAAWLLSSTDRTLFEKLRAQLKRLRRRAGAVRDIDVARLVLKSLTSSPAARRDVSLVRDSLRKKRRERAERLLAFIRKHPRGGVAGAARSLLLMSKSLKDARLLKSCSALDARVRRLAATDPRSIEDLHTLRIAGKRALLAGEIVRPMPRESIPLASLVDQIGRLLDLQVALVLTREELSKLATVHAVTRANKHGHRRAQSATTTRAIQRRALVTTLRRQAMREKSRVVALCRPPAPPRSRRRSVQ